MSSQSRIGGDHRGFNATFMSCHVLDLLGELHVHVITALWLWPWPWPWSAMALAMAMAMARHGQAWAEFGRTLGRVSVVQSRWVDFWPCLGQAWAKFGPGVGRVAPRLGQGHGSPWPVFCWPEFEPNLGRVWLGLRMLEPIFSQSSLPCTVHV